MNFFKEINRLKRKYDGTSHAHVVDEVLWVTVDLLKQIESQLRRRQQSVSREPTVTSE